MAFVWHDTLRAIAAASRQPVVLVGSTPPDAADLDVLVRDTDLAAVERALAEHGAVRVGAGWLVPGDDPLGVDLLTPSSWNLPDAARDQLWERACGLPEHPGVVTPDPAHELLLAARRLAWNGALGERSRHRARRARSQGASSAAALAPAWHAESALRSLLGLLEHGRAPRTTDRVRAVAAELRGRGIPPARAWARAVRVVLPEPRRGALIAVSGADGSGKSTVTLVLVEALAAAGMQPVRHWMRFSHAPLAHLVAVGVKRLLGRERVQEAGHQGPATVAGDAVASSGPVGAGTPPLLTVGWSWLLTVTFVVRAVLVEVDRRRGRTVVCDRYVLDALAELLGRYGLPGDHLTARILRALTPDPTVALYLDVPPEVAVARQDDDQWSAALLASSIAAYQQLGGAAGVRVVDGTAERDAVAAEALAATLQALQARTATD